MNRLTKLAAIFMLVVGLPLGLGLYDLVKATQAGPFRVALPGPILGAVPACDPGDPEPEPEQCPEGEILCCYGTGNCECVIPQQCSGQPQDLQKLHVTDDAANCTSSISPSTGETLAHVWERRAACIVGSPEVPLPGPGPVTFEHALSPGASLSAASSSAVDVEIGANTTSSSAINTLVTWFLQHVGDVVVSPNSVVLAGEVRWAPWDSGTGLAKLDGITLTATLPSLDVYDVELGETTITVETVEGGFEPVGIMSPETGEFQIFMLTRVTNSRTGVNGIGPILVSFGGTMTDEGTEFAKLNFVHPTTASEIEIGKFLATLVRDIVTEIPIARFRSPAHQAALDQALVDVVAKLDAAGGDVGTLATVAADFETDVAHLVDGIAGWPVTDDAMKASAPSALRWRVFHAHEALYKYLDRYFSGATQ